MNSQFAGEVGLVSIGLGKDFNRYGLGGMYGIVPQEFSGGPVIETVTLRQTYRFYEWRRIDFHGGLNIYHALGVNYNTENFKSSPRDYYSMSSLRALFNLGLSIRMRKEESVYFESGINDIWITNWIANQGLRDPTSQITLALGFKKSF